MRELARRYGGVAVLKGANTLVATAEADEPPRVCDRGNPGMATGGMGDVLAGVIGSLLVQSREPRRRACAPAVLLHALAGDAAAARRRTRHVGQRPLSAPAPMGESELIKNFRSEAELIDSAGQFARGLRSAGCRPLVIGLAGDARQRQDHVGARDAARARP